MGQNYSCDSILPQDVLPHYFRDDIYLPANRNSCTSVRSKNHFAKLKERGRGVLEMTRASIIAQ